MAERKSRRWKERARELGADSYALYRAARDPRVPWYAKLLAGAVAAYAVSPVDLIPDFIPVLGMLDDLVIVPLGIALALKMIPSDVMNEHRQAARERFSKGLPRRRIGSVKDAKAGVRVFRVLFVCVENSTRSQMAEAFARMHGAGVLEAWSAGSKASGSLNPRAVAAMGERGYDLTTHRSKSLVEVGTEPWDYLVTMGCGDECPWMPAAKREDWKLPDPHMLSSDEFNTMRDEIERRVLDLIGRLRATERTS